MSAIADTVRTIYRHWARQDIDAALPYIGEGFCMHILVPSAVTPHGGLCAGRESAIARLRMLIADFKFLKYQPGPIATSGDTMAAAQVELRYRHKRSGVTVETRLGHFWTFEKGKAAELIEYHDVDRIAAFASQAASVMAARAL